MLTPTRRLALLVVLYVTAVAWGNAGEADAPRYVPPVPLGTTEPDWPPRHGRDALVYLRAVVSASGKVQSVEALDRGFHEPVFMRAIMATVKKWRYRPATRDGNAVEATTIITIMYTERRLDSTTTMGKSFRTELQKVDELFKQGDYAGADFHAQSMLEDEVSNTYEYAALKTTLAQTHASLGQDYLAIRNAQDATERPGSKPLKFPLHQPIPQNSFSNYLLPKELVLPLLRMRMELAAKNGMLREAMEAYYELAGLEPLAPDDPHVVGAAEITGKLTGSEPLHANGQIPTGMAWEHKLYRHRFTLDEVRGSIESLVLDCDGKRQQLQYVPGEEWPVPEWDEDCSIEVRGEAGASFKFTELPD